MCGEREASSRYFRLNRVTEEVEGLCRPCWLTLRHAKEGEWRYFLGVGRFFFLFTVLPLLILGALLGLLVAWLI